jgi:uncharacterized membrane protein
MTVKNVLSTLGWMLAVVTVTLVIAFHWLVAPVINHQHGLTPLEHAIAARNDLMSEVTNTASVTGGRSRGGTFSAPAPSRSPVPYSSPEPEYRPRRSSPPVYVPTPVPVPGPTVYLPSPGYTSVPVAGQPTGGVDMGFIFVLLVLGFIILPIIINYLKLGSNGTATPTTNSTPINELQNSIVTVTRLQVGLLAQARALQGELDKLALAADTSTAEGLSKMLQETVLTLLRYPDYWVYARGSSETLPSREAGSQRFEQLSLEERSKFSEETLVNVNGQIQQRESAIAESTDIPSYIVVTLIIGTAHDAPFFRTISSVEEVKAALQKLGSLPPGYLLVYELVWTPQVTTDTLSENDLMANYAELVRL